MFLARTRKDGEQMMKGVRGGGSAWTADKFAVRVYPFVLIYCASLNSDTDFVVGCIVLIFLSEGGASSTPLYQKTNDATNLLLTGRDAAGDMQCVSYACVVL